MDTSFFFLVNILPKRVHKIILTSIKTRAIFQNTEIHRNISNILDDSFFNPQTTYLVSGEGTMVEFPDDPTRNYLGAIRYSEKTELFLAEENI